MASLNLTSGRLLARNTVWNLIGMVAPLFVGIVAIPLLIDGMGKERFGLLSIIWMGVGYFSLFDMGLGRALTKLLAERLAGRRPDEEIACLIWTALQIIFGLGIIAALLLLMFARGVPNVFNVPQNLKTETIVSFRVLAAGIPMVVLSSALIGILQAHQKFAVIAIVRIPLGILTFLGPLIALQIDESLVLATSTLLIARFFALISYGLATVRTIPLLSRPQWLRTSDVRPLLAFGGWLTFTNMIGPLMVSFDRFVVGMLLSLTAVTYYVTPFEMLSRLRIFPQALMSVLFPALTMTSISDRGRFIELYRNGAKVLFYLLLPVLSLFFWFGKDGLYWWVGEEISYASVPVVHWLTAGWLINVLARMPLTTLQAVGRPDLTAKLHMVELLPYATILYVFTMQFGIAGTAAAWFIRMFFDTIFLNLLAWKHIPKLGGAVKKSYLLIFMVVTGFGATWMVNSLSLRIILFFGVCSISLIRLWPVFRKFQDGQIAGADNQTMEKTLICMDAVVKEVPQVAGANWPLDELEPVNRCPVCGSTVRTVMFEALSDRIFFCAPGRWKLIRCSGCSSAYLDPRPTVDSISRAYQVYYTHTHRESVSTEKLGRARKMVRAFANGYRNAMYKTSFSPEVGLGKFIISMIPPMREKLDREMRYMPAYVHGKRLLDVGFGSGKFLDFAKRAGWDSLGVDPDPVTVANAAERGLSVAIGGINAVCTVAEQFDFITMSHVIEHMHDPSTAVEKAYSLLKPGGWLFVDTPNIQSAGCRRYGSSWRGLEPPRHLVLFSWNSLSTLLRRCGFTNLVPRPSVFKYANIAAKSRAILRGDDPYRIKGVSSSERLRGAVQVLRTWIDYRHSEFVTILAQKPEAGDPP
jgi:O-antigen/teichoic acid export membrane protein/2-polyprenyl-3-methyl-5-hydroxy-6-metoxy-1,4-benzoquinol methylase